MKRTIILLVILTLFFSTIGVGAEDVIKIGAIAARSGNNAALGERQADGANMAVEEINAQNGVLGKKIELVLEDSQGVPSTAVSALNKLIYRDQVDIAIGDCQSSPTLAMLPVIERAKIPLLAHGTNSKITNQGNKWVFRTRPSDTVKFGSTAKYAAEKLGFKNIAIFHGSAEYGVGGADAAEAGLKEGGVETVIREQWTPGSKDFSSQLLNIKDAEVDGIILIGQMVDMGLVMKQAKQMNIKAQFIGGAGIESDTTYEASDGASEGVIFGSGFIASGDDLQVNEFVKKFKEKYGYTPDAFAATGYDAIYLAVKAIEEAGSTKNTDLQTALRNLKYDGIEGLYNFNENGEGLHSVGIGIVKNGNPVPYNNQQMTIEGHVDASTCPSNKNGEEVGIIYG